MKKEHVVSTILATLIGATLTSTLYNGSNYNNAKKETNNYVENITNTNDYKDYVQQKLAQDNQSLKNGEITTYQALEIFTKSDEALVEEYLNSKNLNEEQQELIHLQQEENSKKNEYQTSLNYCEMSVLGAFTNLYYHALKQKNETDNNNPTNKDSMQQ